MQRCSCIEPYSASWGWQSYVNICPLQLYYIIWYIIISYWMYFAFTIKSYTVGSFCFRHIFPNVFFWLVWWLQTQKWFHFSMAQVFLDRSFSPAARWRILTANCSRHSQKPRQAKVPALSFMPSYIAPWCHRFLSMMIIYHHISYGHGCLFFEVFGVLHFETKHQIIPKLQNLRASATIIIFLQKCWVEPLGPRMSFVAVPDAIPGPSRGTSTLDPKVFGLEFGTFVQLDHFVFCLRWCFIFSLFSSFVHCVPFFSQGIHLIFRDDFRFVNGWTLDDMRWLGAYWPLFQFDDRLGSFTWIHPGSTRRARVLATGKGMILDLSRCLFPLNSPFFGRPLRPCCASQKAWSILWPAAYVPPRQCRMADVRWAQCCHWTWRGGAMRFPTLAS